MPKSLKTIEQIDQLLRNLQKSDPTSEEAKARVKIIHLKMHHLKDKVLSDLLDQKIRMEEKIQRYDTLKQHLRISQENNYRIEKRLQKYKQIYFRKGYLISEYEKMQRKKKVSEEKIKWCQKRIRELEGKLKRQQISQSQESQEAMVERVFERLRKYLSKDKIEDFRHEIRNTSSQNHDSESQNTATTQSCIKARQDYPEQQQENTEQYEQESEPECIDYRSQNEDDNEPTSVQNQIGRNLMISQQYQMEIRLCMKEQEIDRESQLKEELQYEYEGQIEKFINEGCTIC